MAGWLKESGLSGTTSGSGSLGSSIGSIAAGRLIRVTARIGAIGATVSCADNQDGAYVLAKSQADASDNTLYEFYLYPTVNTGSRTVTVTASSGSIRFNTSWFTVPTGTTSVAVATTNSATAHSTSVASGNVTASNGDLVAGCVTNTNSVGSAWTAGGTSAGGTWATDQSFTAATPVTYSQYVVATAGGIFASAPTYDQADDLASSIAVYAASGGTNTSTNRDARITGAGTNTSTSQDARITGVGPTYNAVTTIAGPQVCGNLFSISYTLGGTTSNTTRDVRLTGQATSTTNRDVKLTGQLLSTINMDVRLTGQGTVSTTNYDVRLTSQGLQSTVSDVRVTGQNPSSIGYDARLTGLAATLLAQDTRVTGQNSSSINNDARLIGQSSSLISNSVRLIGQGTSLVVRDVRIFGVLAASYATDVSIIGVLPDPPVVIDPEFDANRHESRMGFQVVSAGYYWMIGMEDATNRLAYRNLPVEDAKFQSDYDGGYAQGLWNLQYLRQEWM